MTWQGASRRGGGGPADWPLRRPAGGGSPTGWQHRGRGVARSGAAPTAGHVPAEWVLGLRGGGSCWRDLRGEWILALGGKDLGHRTRDRATPSRVPINGTYLSQVLSNYNTLNKCTFSLERPPCTEKRSRPALHHPSRSTRTLPRPPRLPRCRPATQPTFGRRKETLGLRTWPPPGSAAPPQRQVKTMSLLQPSQNILRDTEKDYVRAESAPEI